MNHSLLTTGNHSKVRGPSVFVTELQDEDAGITPRVDLMRIDSRGNQLGSLDVPQQGRYISRSNQDIAFKKLNRIGELQKPSGIRLHQRPSALSMKMSASGLHTAGLHSNDPQGTNDVSICVQDTIDTDAKQDTDKKETPTTEVKVAPQNEAAEISKGSGSKNSFGMAAVVGLRKWRIKARDRFGNNSRFVFAKDDKHLKLLTQHADDVVTELPLPLKLSVFEELLPVIQSTVRIYTKELGKKHRLTREAKMKCIELTKEAAVLSEIMY